MAVCYRHPTRETGVSCSNCGNPICPDCMTATPVGMRCPDCSKQRTQVRTMRSIAVEPTVTYALIAINVLMYFGQTASPSNAVYRDFVLFGPFVADGEWWRLLTAGFLHCGLFGAAIVMARNRGIDLMASGLLPILLINLAITFFPGFNISIGGHLGGL